MSFQVFSNIGNNREKNEDSYLIKPIKGEIHILAVADGMGGHQAGEIASRIATESIKNYSFDFKDQKDIKGQINSAVIEANHNIIDYSKKHEDCQDMGTTLTMCLIVDQVMYYGHVGDSRVYIFNEKLQQITKDHSLVNDLVDNNSIKPEQVFNHPDRNIITQALGIDRNLKVQINQISVSKKDTIMLCTDGLSDMIRFDEIEKILKENNDIEVILQKLGAAALQNGGNDNITIIMGKI
ncbi:MAG: Stp1/IreP family PP2C-type Ser/Thr phosphatase [Cyclobacterium sp.]|uniref:Stp1/IreP family PP2C-type Ser/Thr phosphatase n=1 Tax=Cyclobacterium sp. TaxID=1966343 RepID=UPI003970D512